MTKRLIIIDDDADFLKSNQLYFTKKGYEVFCCQHPRDALDLLDTADVSCVILDIDIPEMNGFEICQKLRENSAVPVIFVSGHSHIKNRIASFRSGGDDFLAKPYDILELELRIEARIRKSESVFYKDTLQFGSLSIDLDQRIISCDGNTAELPALQFDILALLAQNPGKVFSYEQLYDQVWKSPIVGSRHNLQVTVASLRQKLTELCGEQNFIRTKSRKGYYFDPGYPIDEKK